MDCQKVKNVNYWKNVLQKCEEGWSGADGGRREAIASGEKDGGMAVRACERRMEADFISYWHAPLHELRALCATSRAQVANQSPHGASQCCVGAIVRTAFR
jgi:hypothetical protein